MRKIGGEHERFAAYDAHGVADSALVALDAHEETALLDQADDVFSDALALVQPQELGVRGPLV